MFWEPPAVDLGSNIDNVTVLGGSLDQTRRLGIEISDLLGIVRSLCSEGFGCSLCLEVADCVQWVAHYDERKQSCGEDSEELHVW